MTSTTVNRQLVESLIQAIYALSPLEQNIVRSRLLSNSFTELPRKSVIDIFNETPGQQIFQTPEEVDRYLQQERASWES
ncbi:hypothetical protein [Limnofasciculus baicalensis]|uniref:Uncharacterized protein n=1 Tax=Limnofasciculus baicalensis BBK-W-15 TaxID=2699891 RepID=A0AAE3KPE5_9CYAN|nr:hypothetical protein [Limnofasciculus baicalensis]MCP2731460.1 hypothetical protein [Limnofasciculus baicalensis BBK-W-15]